MSNEVPPPVDPPRFVPPVAPPPAPVPLLPPPPPPGYVYAPVAPPARNTGLLIGVIVGAVVVVLAGLTATAVIVVTILHGGKVGGIGSAGGTGPTGSPSSTSAPTLDPLTTGDPGSPIALKPMDCTKACFGSDSIEATIPDDEVFFDLGLDTKTDEYGSYDPSDVTYEYNQAVSTWTDGLASPDECFSIYIVTPVVGSVDQKQTGNDQIDYTGSHANKDQTTQIGQTTRLFDTEAAASAYMTQLDKKVEDCDHYQAGTGDSHWEAEVTPEPALQLPGSVAAVGWVEDSPYASRYYSIDLQRGNLVVRTSMYTEGDVTEGQFRDFVENEAKTLAKITPGSAI